MSKIWRNPPAGIGRRVSEMSLAGERDNSNISTLFEPPQPIPPNWTPIGIAAQRVVSSVARVRANGAIQ